MRVFRWWILLNSTQHHFSESFIIQSSYLVCSSKVWTTYRVDHKFGNAVFCWLWVSWLREGFFLGSNERYIPKLQNDTNLALIPWLTLVLGDIQVSKKTLNSPLIISYENWHDVKILIGRYQLFFCSKYPIMIIILCYLLFL